MFVGRKNCYVTGRRKKRSSTCYQNILVSPCPSNFEMFEATFSSMELVIRMQLIPSFYYTIILFNIFSISHLPANSFQIYQPYSECAANLLWSVLLNYLSQNNIKIFFTQYHKILYKTLSQYAYNTSKSYVLYICKYHQHG